MTAADRGLEGRRFLRSADIGHHRADGPVLQAEAFEEGRPLHRQDAAEGLHRLIEQLEQAVQLDLEVRAGQGSAVCSA